MLIIINNSVFIVSILPHKCLIIQRKLLVSFVCAPIKACAKPGSQTGGQPSGASHRGKVGMMTMYSQEAPSMTASESRGVMMVAVVGVGRWPNEAPRGIFVEA